MKWKFITISQTGSGSKRDCEEGFGSDYVTAQISLRMITELLAMDFANKFAQSRLSPYRSKTGAAFM